LISGILVLSLLASNQAWAKGCPNAVLLRVGEKVTDCDRIGLNLEFDKQVREQIVQYEFNLKIIEEQKKMLDLKDLTISTTREQAELWKIEAERLRKKDDEKRWLNTPDFIIGFLSGMAVMALAGWTVGQVANSSK
jgi:hypothetical protein